MDQADRSMVERVLDEQQAQRELMLSVHQVVARMDERLSDLVTQAEDRQRKTNERIAVLETKTSERMAALETRQNASERRWWLLLGAYGAIPVAWAVLHTLKGK